MVLNFPTKEKKEPLDGNVSVQSMDFTYTVDGMSREIRCPQCNTIWIAESMEGFEDFKACHQLDIMDCGHILFRIEMIFDNQKKPHFFRHFNSLKESEFVSRFHEFYKGKINKTNRHQYPDLAFYEILFNDPILFGEFGYDFLDTVFVTPDNQKSDFRSGNKRRIIFGFQDENKEIQRLFKTEK